MSKIFNQNNTINSLQVSTVYNIPAGNFNPGLVFLTGTNVLKYK